MLYRTNIFYNNFNLSNIQGIAIYSHHFINAPSRIINRQKLARSDKSVLMSAEYSDKTVVIKGIATGNNKSEIELAWENLKGILQVPEGTIKLELAGQQVEFTGTLNATSEERFGKHLKFTLEMICSNPIGRAQSITSLINVNNTSPSRVVSMTIEGSYKAQPVIRIIINSVTGGTAKTIQVLNAETFQGITVTRDWTAGEILTVDSFNKLVEVDDVSVEYGGVFPTFYPGARSFQYIDDFTTRSVDIDVVYNKQYT